MLCGLVHGERTAQAALYEVPCSARGTQRAVDVHRSQESACLDARRRARVDSMLRSNWLWKPFHPRHICYYSTVPVLWYSATMNLFGKKRAKPAAPAAGDGGPRQPVQTSTAASIQKLRGTQQT